MEGTGWGADLRGTREDYDVQLNRLKHISSSVFGSGLLSPGIIRGCLHRVPWERAESGEFACNN